MRKKLKQKRLLKGVMEFEIVDETIFIRKKSLFREEKLTVDLSVLEPEPVVQGTELVFYNPHKGRPVFSLWINKPARAEYEEFVATLLNTISGEEGDIALVSAETAQAALDRNIYEEPPAFVEEDGSGRESFEPVNVERLNDDIQMLKTYLDDERYTPLFTALEALKAEPNSETVFNTVLAAYNDLGIYQGSVLTYAPYLIVIFSKYSQ